MSTFDTLEAAEAPYVRMQMLETWGHLDPQPGEAYTGHFDFIKGGYQAVDCQPVNSEFSFSGAMDFYSAMQDFIFERCCNGGLWSGKPDGLYRWKGQLRRFKNGRIVFEKGTLTLLWRM